MSNTLIRIISMVAYVFIAPFIGGLLEGIDRKISARMQGRKGPSIFQPFYDIAKLFSKQVLTVNPAQYFMLFSYVFFVIFSGTLFFGGFDLLLCFFASTTASMFLYLTACASHSPYSFMGAQRELLQMMAYEPMELLTAVGFFLATRSFDVSKILSYQLSPIVKLPGFFLGFVFILTIKMRKSPFDLSTSHHAHQEMIKGLTGEMSGGLYGLVEVAEWYEMVFLLGVVGLFFVNSNPLSFAVAFAVIVAVYFLEIFIDNVSARFKWSKALKWAWVVTLLTGGINLLILELIA